MYKMKVAYKYLRTWNAIAYCKFW